MMTAMQGDPYASLARWWKDPGDYRWPVAFLDARGLLPALKRLIALLGAVMAWLAVLMQITPMVTHTVAARTLLALIALTGVAWTLRWWLGDWPSVRESLVLVAIGDIAIATAAVLHTDALAALAAAPLFAVMGAYIVFFHSPKVHACHIAFVAAVIIAMASWLAIQSGVGGVALGLAKGTIALVVTVAILPVLQFGSWLIQHNTTDSHADPLTNLTNRRGLNAGLRRLRAASDAREPLSALWIDLDGFKSINDNLGHLVGDAVLIRTADRIRNCVRRGAAVMRIGGEEFLVLDTFDAATAAIVGERIRCAIAAPADPPVTASIGLATTDNAADADIDALLAAADAAMYQAKRLGGDRVASVGADGMRADPIQ